MVFVRHKTVKGHRYYQIVRNFRKDGVHRQEVVCHLGVHDSIDAAIEAEKLRIAGPLQRYEYQAAFWRERLAGAETELGLHGGVLDEGQAQRLEAELTDDPNFFDAPRWWESPQWRQAAYSLAFHEAQRHVARYEGLVESRRARLDKLLDVKEKYF